MDELNRRSFLQQGGAGIAAAALWHAGARAEGGAKLRHAVIGVGGQGQQHVQCFASHPDCDVRWVCDPDRERLAKVAADTGTEGVEDFRRVLDNPEVDSVSIVTQDHWHTPLALMALDAGKHVYLEKPCIHSVHEGRVLLEAARKSGKCVQHGTQARGSQGIIDGIRFVREGGVGKVRLAKAINHQYRDPLPEIQDSDPPDTLNYDLWLGPAPMRPFNKARYHYNWRWQWDYGCGDIGNDGIHQVDQARWGLGVAVPNAVSASGGQLFYNDIHETPDTQMVTFEYEECYLVFEMRLWTDYPLEGHDNGVIFYGEEGTVQIGRKGCFAHFKNGETKQVGGGANIQENINNYIECARNNAPEKLLAPIEEGVYSALLCHFGNIATRVGERLRINAADWTTNVPAANALLRKAYRAPYVHPVLKA